MGLDDDIGKISKDKEELNKYDGQSLTDEKIEEISDRRLEAEKYYRRLNEGKVFICNMEYNESKDFFSYFEYCLDWFIKMIWYREAIEYALGIKLSNIKDNDLFVLTDKKYIRECSELVYKS